MWTEQEAKTDSLLEAAFVLQTLTPAFNSCGQKLGQSCGSLARHGGGNLKPGNQGRKWAAKATY